MKQTADALFERTALQKQGILERLRQKGYRITAQRQMLIDVILEHHCASCKEIYLYASKKDAGIGMATVYRFMNVLEEIGALRWKNGYQFRYDGEDDGILMQVRFTDGTMIRLDRASLTQILQKALARPGREIEEIMVPPGS